MVYLSQIHLSVHIFFVYSQLSCNDLLVRAVRDTGLKQKKAEALFFVYKRGLDEGRFDSLYAAGQWCAKQPAPCFYISAKRASLLLGRVFAGESLSKIHASQRRMVRRLLEDYNRFLAEHPDNTLSRERILELLVDEPAPEFYISGDAARKILREQIKRARRRKRWFE